MQIGLLIMLIGIILFAMMIFPKKSKKSDTARLKQVMVNYIRRVAPSAPANDIASAIIEASNELGVPAGQILTLARKESTFDPNSRGRDGEIGLMQVLPTTFDWVEMVTGWTGDRWDIRYNVRCGTYYFRHCYRLAGERGYTGEMRLKKAFAYYNRGPNKDQDINYWYVHQIWPIYREIRSMFVSNGLANYV